MPAAGSAIIPCCMRMPFIGAPFCIAAMLRAVVCMDIGRRPEGLCIRDDRKPGWSFEILIREENIDVRGWLGMILVRDCFGVTRSLSFAASALELASCVILPGAGAEERAEAAPFGNAPEPVMFGYNAKRWL